MRNWAGALLTNPHCRAWAPGSGCAIIANTCSRNSPNVSVYRESRLGAQDVVGFGADHVVLATGSSWRKDGIGAMGETPAEIRR